MRYIQGIDRNQITLLPEVLDDYVSDHNPVRFIEAYVNTLNVREFGFTYSDTKETGRKPYNPKDMLKLYIYGYLNKIRSSRQLEKATYQNIELIWLQKKLHPDFKTIADFRKDNFKPLKQVCRNFILLCKKLDLFGCELVAIDGSKFSASNSNRNNYTKNKLEKLIKRIDEHVADYLQQMEHDDHSEASVSELSADELNKKIQQLQERRNKYQQLQSKLEKSGETQISLTDPDSRMMRTQQGRDVAYNVQIVTDDKHKLILSYDVTNECNDKKQLSVMALEAKKILDVEKLTVLADTGYWDRGNIKICHDENIECFVPRPQKFKNTKNDFFTFKTFRYDSKEDCYWCPAGQKLIHKGQRLRDGILEKTYRTTACKTCPKKNNCTKDKWTRRIYRWIHEDLAEQLEAKVKKNPEKMNLRKTLVEHPFGTLKHTMGHKDFLTRGIEKVNGEMSLSVLCYNIKRVLNILTFKELMLAVQ